MLNEVMGNIGVGLMLQMVGALSGIFSLLQSFRKELFFSRGSFVIYLLFQQGIFIGQEILYLQMGGIETSSLKNLDFNSAKVLCVGFSSDIVYSADNETTNQILKKLKSYEEGQMFKYRIRDPQTLSYFAQYAKVVVEMRPWKDTKSLIAILFLKKKGQLRVHSIMLILKKELSIQENESLFLYRKGKLRLCQPHEQLSLEDSRKQETQAEHIHFDFSKMEISG